MRLRLAVAPIIVLLATGCGGHPELVEENPVRGSLEAIFDSLSEARDSVRALSERRDAANGDRGDETVPALRVTLASVVAAAKDLVVVTSGKPTEPDAKAILSAAQELDKKATGSASLAEIRQGLEDLRSKAAALKSRL